MGMPDIKGPQAATIPSKKLGRTWRMVAHNLDNDFEGAARNTTWMPSHGAVGTIRQTLDSNGAAISSIMWRANRLVDLTLSTSSILVRILCRMMIDESLLILGG